MAERNNRVRSLGRFLGGSQERVSLRTVCRQAAGHLKAKAKPISKRTRGELGGAGISQSIKQGFGERVCWICVITSKLVTNHDSEGGSFR